MNFRIADTFVTPIPRPKKQRGKPGQQVLHDVAGLRGEDAGVKETTMETYRVPGVNNLKSFGRWAFAELTGVWTMAAEPEAELNAALDGMIAGAAPTAASRDEGVRS